MKLKAFDITKVKVGDKAYDKNGTECTIICIDRPGDYPIVTITYSKPEGDIALYTKEGKYYWVNEHSIYDLMLAVTTKTYYIVLWIKDGVLDTTSGLIESEQRANMICASQKYSEDYQAQIVKVEIEE